MESLDELGYMTRISCQNFTILFLMYKRETIISSSSRKILGASIHLIQFDLVPDSH